MTKEELKEELKDVKVLYFVTNKTGNKFWIFYVKDNDFNRLVIDRTEKDTPAEYVRMKMKNGLWYNDYFENYSKSVDKYYDTANAISLWLYGVTNKFKAIRLEWHL